MRTEVIVAMIGAATTIGGLLLQQGRIEDRDHTILAEESETTQSRVGHWTIQQHWQRCIVELQRCVHDQCDEGGSDGGG
jgi:hypothetical protein